MSEERATTALARSGIDYTIVRHGPVTSLAEAAHARGVTTSQIVKTLVVRRGEDGQPDLLYIDLHIMHEVTSPQAFEGLRMAGRNYGFKGVRMVAQILVPAALPADRIEEIATEAEAFFGGLADQGVEVRGVYDLAGMRAGADYLIWWHAESNDQLQSAFKAFRRTELGARSHATWSVSALHRPAEFNKSHVPAFLAGGRVREYLCLYPFVRSVEWYLMEPDERRGMLVEHGQKARDYAEVRANTIPAFGLGDYEWVLALEAPELVDLVDMMRHFRNTEARLHVREETPFYTGRRVSTADLAEVLR